MFDKPIPPNEVLDPKFNGWRIKRVNWSMPNNTTTLIIYDPNGPWDSFGPIMGVSKAEITLDAESSALLQNTYDRLEYEELSEKLHKLGEKLAAYQLKSGLQGGEQDSI